MARAHLRLIVVDRAGNAIQNARCYPRERNTTTPLADLWTAETGGSLVTELVSDAAAGIELWVDVARRIDVLVTDNGHQAYYSGYAGGFIPFPDYTLTAVDINPDPALVGVSDHGALSGLADDDHTQYQLRSEKGSASGYASLDGSGTVPDAQLPGTIARDAEVTAAVSTHEGAADPHPTYETSAEAQAKVDAHAAAGDPHPTYETSTEAAAKVTAHEVAADPHAGYQKESEKGAVSGYASLDGSGTVPDAQIPSTIARDSELPIVPAFATPAVVLGTTAAAGTTPTLIRSDSTIQAFDATAPSTQAFGDAAAVGAVAFAARRDHKHAMPANPVVAHEAAADPHTGYQRESEKAAASGYASLDASTLVPRAQLGTGTPDATKLLRGDGTWQLIPSGGSAHTIKESGTGLTARTGLNFDLGLVATDDVGNDETDVSVDYAGTAEIADVATTEAAGTSAKVARGDHVHAHPVSGFATPAVVLGTAAAAGAATTVIRSDATVVAFDATVPSTQAFGDAAATGAAAVAARRDHKHAMPANPTPAFATPAVVLGTAAAAGAAGTVIRSDGTIAAFDATNPTAEAFGDTAAVGTAAFAARRDHRHAMPADPVPAHEAAADPHTGYQKESEKGAASGYASLDGSTLVPFAQLGTGTASGSKFLRDDRTWAVPAGGGGSAHEILVADTPFTQRAGLNFVNDAPDIYRIFFEATDDPTNDETEIAGWLVGYPGHRINVAGTPVGLNPRDTLNFTEGFVGTDDTVTPETEIALDWGGTAQIADIAATESAGTSVKVPHADHVHAHPVFTTGDLHSEYVKKSLYDANTILAATTDDTPAALTVAASRFVGRKASGNIAAMTPTEAKAELAIAESDVTNLTTDLAAKVPKSLYDANTILAATTDDTPAALTVGASTIVGRKATGDISAMSAAELVAIIRNSIPVELGIAVGDETTAITTGTAKVTWRMPFAMTVTSVRASLTTASSSGIPTFDINEGGTTILSTKLTIDASELTSTTAATAAVISDSALADDAEITVDIDVAGTGAKGPKVWLIGTRA